MHQVYRCLSPSEGNSVAANHFFLFVSLMTAAVPCLLGQGTVLYVITMTERGPIIVICLARSWTSLLRP